ncbi:hypothetical protein U1Q18_004932 [Sarracenia purpurea var. burkii]
MEQRPGDGPLVELVAAPRPRWGEDDVGVGEDEGTCGLKNPGHLANHGFGEGEGGVGVYMVKEAKGNVAPLVLVVKGKGVPPEGKVGRPHVSNDLTMGGGDAPLRSDSENGRRSCQWC